MQDDELEKSQTKVLEEGVGININVSELNPSFDIVLALIIPLFRMFISATYGAAIKLFLLRPILLKSLQFISKCNPLVWKHISIDDFTTPAAAVTSTNLVRL
ncbi:MAG: hypothetical protein ACI88H_003871 [Cocleimonas sp.]|jgi:hypothetical protein